MIKKITSTVSMFGMIITPDMIPGMAISIEGAINAAIAFEDFVAEGEAEGNDFDDSLPVEYQRGIRWSYFEGKAESFELADLPDDETRIHAFEQSWATREDAIRANREDWETDDDNLDNWDEKDGWGKLYRGTEHIGWVKATGELVLKNKDGN